MTSKAEEAIARANDPRHLEATRSQITAQFEAGLAAAAVETNALKDMVRTLAEKIESVADTNSTDVAIEALKLEMAKIAERLDGADKGFASIASLEQSIAALFEQLEETRRTALEAAEAAMQNGERDRPSETSSNGANWQASGPEREQRVMREIAELRALQDEADRRIHLTLSAVQETVGKVANRLAKMETDLSEMRPSHLGPLLAPTLAPTLAPIFAPRAERRQEGVINTGFARPEAANAAPIKAKVSAAPGAFARDGGPVEKLHPDNASGSGSRAVEAADFLIEPGSGFPRRREKAETSPDVQPVIAYDREGGAGRADFIAAARRAAQAAQIGATAAAPNVDDNADAETKADPLQARAFFRAHRRLIILGVAALLLAASAYALSKAAVHRGVGEFLADPVEALQQKPRSRRGRLARGRRASRHRTNPGEPRRSDAAACPKPA